MEKVPLLDMWVVVGVVNVALGLIRKVRYLVSREQGAIWIEFIKRTWLSHVDAMTLRISYSSFPKITLTKSEVVVGIGSCLYPNLARRRLNQSPSPKIIKLRLAGYHPVPPLS